MTIPLGPRLVLTLTLAGLLSGLVIVGVYELTLPRILANKAARLESAVYEVVPGCDRVEPMKWAGDRLEPSTGPIDATATDVVYAGYGPGDVLVGWAVPGEGAGFQDTIRLLYGWDPARDRVTGMRVLESRETPGLGDKIIKDPGFVGAFDDLAVEPAVEAVKGGASEAWQVDAITGATISSKAVVRIVNERHAVWEERLE